MKKFFAFQEVRHLMVALDHSPIDRELIQFATQLCSLFPIEGVVFIYVAQPLELPEVMQRQYPFFLSPVDENAERDLKKNINDLFKTEEEVESYLIVQEGNVVENIIRHAKANKTDLILMGRKSAKGAIGAVAERIARKTYCATFFLPEGRASKINHISVPVDFSHHSELALQCAWELRKRLGAQITCLHVYETPSGYSKTGKSYEDFSATMQQHVRNEFKSFVGWIFPEEDDLELPFYLACADGTKKAKLLHEMALELSTDLMLVGSKGRSASSSVLIGSIAEGLIRRNRDYPLMMVKNKGENMGFLDALLKV